MGNCHPSKSMSTSASPRSTMVFSGWQFPMLPLTSNSEDGVNGSKILHPQNRGVKTCYFHWKTDVLQNKLVKSEGLFGRLVSIQTSEKNDDKRLCMSRNYKLMVQIESDLLSKSVDLPFTILLMRCTMGQKTVSEFTPFLEFDSNSYSLVQSIFIRAHGISQQFFYMNPSTKYNKSIEIKQFFEVDMKKKIFLPYFC